MGAFEAAWLPYETRCKTGRLVPKFMLGCRVGIFRNERTRSTPLDTKLTFWCVSYYLGLFGCHTKLDAKWAELVQKFVPQRRVQIFCNKRTRSTPFDPKLTFWCISYHLGPSRTAWLSYETRCKTGRTSANVHATKSRQNFSQRTRPIHSVRT